MWRLFFLIFCLGVSGLVAAEKVHVVEKGETLYQIGRDYHVTTAEIIQANPGKIGSSKSLKVGQKLRIPVPDSAPKTEPSKPAKKAATDESDDDSTDDNASAPALYVVKKGDTISGIGRKFKIAPDELRELNRLKSNTLHVGQKLKVRSQAGNSSSTDSPPAKSEPKPNAVGTGGQSTSRPPADRKHRYLFIDKVKDKIDAPHVVPGRWKYVVVHHSGTPSGNARIFDYFHKNIRGMENGLAYHFVIGNGHDSGDGEIEVGDRWRRQIQGGHLHSDALNEIAIGICFVGDFNNDRPTKKQIAAAIELITYLNEICGTPPVFKAHREINPRPTECPGKNFPVQAFHQLFDR